VPERIQVQASTISSAQPDEIYALLVNSATYPLWSMIRYYESLRPGRQGLHDVGALRLFKTNAVTVMREEVTDVVPNERVSYRLLSGFPLLDYRSQTTLEKTASGTRIVWESSFHPEYPLTAWYWRRLMTWVLERLVRSLAQTAEDTERRSRILALAQGKVCMSKHALRGGSGRV
jgi:uncharacterized protein YndB with AHSA1/START domain